MLSKDKHIILGKRFSYTIVSVALAAILYFFSVHETKDTKHYADQISSFVQEQELYFSNYSKEIFEATSSNQELISWKTQHQSKADFFIYNRDSLISFTTNQVDLNLPPSVYGSQSSLVSLNNGWYLLQKKILDDKCLIGLSLIKINYKFSNTLLKNEFPISGIPYELIISDAANDFSHPIIDVKGHELGHVYFESDEDLKSINLLSYISIFFLLSALLYAIWLLASLSLCKMKPYVSFILLGSVLLLLRFIMIKHNLPSEFGHLKLFDPTLFASSFFAGSLGQLVISLLFLLLWLLWGLRFKVFDIGDTRGIKLITVFFSFATLFFSNLILWIFSSLIIDSVISLELYNILSLSVSSIVALCCILVVFYLHFIVIKNATTLSTHHKTNKLYFLCIGLFYLLFYFINQRIDFEDYFFIGVWLGAYLFLIFRLHRSQSNVFRWRFVFIHMILYALISMFLLENLYENKERSQRKFFASKLLIEKDYIAEYEFNAIASDISNDDLIKSAILNQKINLMEIRERLSVLYLRKNFQNYDFDIFIYDSAKSIVAASDSASEKFIFPKLDTTHNSALISVEDSAITDGYVGIVPFSEESAYKGALVILFKPKLFYAQNLYPELLTESQSAFSFIANFYDYAIYTDGKLLLQKGDYPYPYYWQSSDWKEGDDGFFETSEWEHFITKSKKKSVIVSIKQEGFFEPMATFSYFFIILSLLALLTWTLQKFVFKNSIDESAKISFRTKLQAAMMFVVAFAFFVIGFVTVSFIEQQYETYYAERFSKKVKSILTGLEYSIKQHVSSINEAADVMKLEASKLSEINNMDINIYDKSGYLLQSTRPEIFQRGLISKRIDPVALDKMLIERENQFIQKEHIGRLTYSSFYIPLRNKEKIVLGYLNIPYLQKSQDVQKEVSSFLITILNVYAFLLICAGIISFFIANSITKPLQFISEKLKQLNLQQANEPIEWKSNDEIGKLIGEYNKMIVQLDRSARQLAKREREMAWRQMARQIAHEIKNPLTPMKLSIQHLQRAIDDNSPNVSELAKRVNRTLIEQIDNLSSIASAFSSFASMPKPNNVKVNINQILSDIVGLFEKDSGCELSFLPSPSNRDIFADKSQLISVFNNLIKNAIQSTDERNDGKIDISVKEETGNIIVAVSDNGKGIAPEQFDKVFVPNFTTKSSGTGLGLAISKQIIDNLNGSISFESKVGKGTTIYVSIPLSVV